MGRLELQLIPAEFEKIASMDFSAGREVLKKLGAIKEKLESRGYSLKFSYERYRGLPTKLIVSHSIKSYNEISRIFDSYDDEIR